MIRQSLRLRLWAAAGVSIGVALLVAGLGLVNLFERQVEQRLGAELRILLNQLAAAVTEEPDGGLALLREPLDPRFDQPLSGRYWQIDDLRAGLVQPGRLRSRSLWDDLIVLPADTLETGAIHDHTLPGPNGQRLLVRERRLLLPAGQAVRLAVALDRAELRAARDAFAAGMRPYLGLIALVLGLATLVQIQTGLAPLEAVRRGVEDIRSGRARRLADRYPEELRPLVGEVNALLAAREQAIARARAWTADLAHGLKTPLSALCADAQRLREQGQPALAEDLEQLAAGMRRRVERELIRGRVRSGAQPHQARAEIGAALQRLIRTLQRTPEGARLAWELCVPEPVAAALMPDDLLELLGNLLENAARWARTRVRVEADAAAGDGVRIRIADDGPGIPEDQFARLGERGLRLDERHAGSGLGLAIVRDVVEAYDGTLGFERAAEGGLAVRVRLPAAESGGD